VRVIDTTLRDSHVKIYEVLRQYVAMTGKSPSKQELARGASLSIVTVYQAEKALKEKGYIESTKDEIRSMRPTDLDRLILNAEPDPWEELEDPKLYWRM
jgi:SOS-response transcriptional repressor LexA